MKIKLRVREMNSSFVYVENSTISSSAYFLALTLSHSFRPLPPPLFPLSLALSFLIYKMTFMREVTVRTKKYRYFSNVFEKLHFLNYGFVRILCVLFSSHVCARFLLNVDPIDVRSTVHK